MSIPVTDGQTPDYSTETRLETSDDQAAPVPENPGADCIPVGGILISVDLLSGLMAGLLPDGRPHGCRRTRFGSLAEP